jgi:hypothetical protein
MWLDWLTSLQNSEGGGLLYSSLEVPMLLLPVVAWAFRTRAGVSLPARLKGASLGVVRDDPGQRIEQSTRSPDA